MKSSMKGATKKRAKPRKLLDLPVKSVRGGDADSIKGGSMDHKHKDQ